MKRNMFISLAFCFAGIFFSCKKTPVDKNPGDAAWIKVIADSNVTFTGKIRADDQSNLYCSYSYVDAGVSNSSAIVKLDTKGNLVWRTSFNSVSIYDFMLDYDDSIVIASATGNAVYLKKLSMNHGDTASGFFGSPYNLPGAGTGVVGMKIIKLADGYLLSGTMSTSVANVNEGFIMKMSSNGIGIWTNEYLLHQGTNGSTSITGCVPFLQDSFLIFGNTQYFYPADVISQFFVMKCNGDGDTCSIHRYGTSSYDADYHGYYCGTSDIVDGGDTYFYACAFNVLYNMPAQLPFPIYTSDDNSARVFRITTNCEVVDSIPIKSDVQNQVVDLVKKHDGGLFIGLNPNPLGDFPFVGERYSFTANISSAFTVENVSYIQTQYSDYLGSVCAISDGYAIQTMIQSLGKDHYKLQVIKTDENGNF